MEKIEQIDLDRYNKIAEYIEPADIDLEALAKLIKFGHIQIVYDPLNTKYILKDVNNNKIIVEPNVYLRIIDLVERGF